jgi:hypothetical protein
VGLAAALVLGIGGSIMAAVDYDIKLTRPMKPGAEYHMAMSGQTEEKNVAKDGVKAAQSEATKSSIDFEAAVKVAEVDKNGTPSKVTLTVEKCVMKAGKEEKTPIVKGTVVVAYIKDKESVFEIAGKPAEEAAAQALAMAVDLGKGLPSDDEVFGSKVRRIVGDKWDMDAAGAAKHIEGEGMTAAKEDIKGTVTLSRVVKIGATECLDVECDMSIGKFTAPLPPGFKIEKGTIQSHYSMKVPVDLTQNVLEDSSEMTITLTIRNKPQAGPDMVNETVSNQKQVTRYTFAK